MPRTSTKSLAFPLAGVSRRGAYRQQTRPFSSPWAINMRTFGPSESRRRGGSRPGLTKLCPTDLGDGVQALAPVAYIDSAAARQYDLVYVGSDGAVGYVRAGVRTATTAETEDSDGVDIFDSNGSSIDWDSTVTAGTGMDSAVRAGRVFLADSVLKAYSPATGVVETITANAGVIPTAETIVAVYRDRIFLAGATNHYHCSRQDDPYDWDHGAAFEDTGRAFMGQLSSAGKIGDVLTAMAPINDKALVLATESTLWVLRGDPTTGTLENVSMELGIVSRDAWTISPEGLLVFLSNDGVYYWDAGTRAAPVRFSEERIPDELREVSVSANTINMVYDPTERGYHLFITPTAPAVGTHWWVDVESKAFWPQRLPAGQQPLAATALLSEGGLGDVVLGSRDGFLRYFLDGKADDDGTEIESHVLIGPLKLAASDTKDALLAEISGVVEGVTANGTVTWRVVMGDSAVQAAELAKADIDLVLDSQDPVSVKGSGTWSEGRNRVSRPRSRGPWLVVWLSSTSAWSFETVSTVARQLGRHR